MSAEIIYGKFPKGEASLKDVPPGLTVEWRIYARNPKDFSMVDPSFELESEAHEAARRWFSQGYDVTVHRHFIEKIAEWTQDDTD